ncbi:MAG TPA: phosphoenolpyruvate--protein phosphotransferase [Candidatus Limnocylindrales bacterium]|nr:phosphoenolpyruvate--protein phosphotransferase [Candidatus Limnocylindrales bacterium]
MGAVTLRGIAAAPGVAIARAWRYAPPAAGDDRIGLEEGSQAAAEALEALAERLRAGGRDEEAGILQAQALMAQDPELIDAARRHTGGGMRASDAILVAGNELATVLGDLGDEVLSARAADVRDVAERIARAIRGQELPRLAERSIAVAEDLPPSVTAELDPQLLAGIALEAGSPTAHAAILSRALGIPAIVGVRGLLAATTEGSELGIDGAAGEVVIDPDPDARARLAAAAATERERVAADRELSATPLATRDGHRVLLGANIGRPEEAAAAAEAGAEAIGLFRTEFMFMGRSAAPAVEAQADAYATALTAFAGRPVVIRLLDVGGDKQLPYLRQEHEENPFLGVRALRLAMTNRELLVGQLRAIALAAARSPAETWVMAPMVADQDDAALLRGLVEEAGGPWTGIRVGIMVEIPSAVVLAESLAGVVDFFSIGTNDLTQYLLAVDRTNAALAERQDPMHPAVLRAIRTTVEGGRAAGIPVAVCGEMAGDPAGAIVLVGLGVDELSMDPRSFGPVKRALSEVTLDDARAAAVDACAAASAADAREVVTRLRSQHPAARQVATSDRVQP